MITCRYCGRVIVLADDVWVDPMATGDDEVWRETCDMHDTFIADHVPEDAPTRPENSASTTRTQRDMFDAWRGITRVPVNPRYLTRTTRILAWVFGFRFTGED